MDRLKADLREHGFGMFEGALDTKTTARIRDRVLEQGAAERRVGYGTTNISVEPHDDVNQWVAFLPNKGKVFRTLISNDRVLETVRFILGANAILSEFSAHVTWPGNKEMGLHIDQWFMPHPVDPNEHYPRPSDVSRTEQTRGDPVTARHPVNPPVVCNVMFAITDFTVENGETGLVSMCWQERLGVGVEDDAVAWEYLRRNPEYRSTWTGSDSAVADGTDKINGLAPNNNGYRASKREVGDGLSRAWSTDGRSLADGARRAVAGGWFGSGAGSPGIGVAVPPATSRPCAEAVSALALPPSARPILTESTRRNPNA